MPVGTIKVPFQHFHDDTFGYLYIYNHEQLTQHLSNLVLDCIMNATDYWPFAREYAIWNIAVTTLQYWTADLKPHALSSTIECVYNFFLHLFSTTTSEPTQRYPIWSLHDHTESHI